MARIQAAHRGFVVPLPDSSPPRPPQVEIRLTYAMSPFLTLNFPPFFLIIYFLNIEVNFERKN